MRMWCWTQWKPANPLFHSLESFSQNFLFQEDQNTLFFWFFLFVQLNSGPVTTQPTSCPSSWYPSSWRRRKKKMAETKTQDTLVLIKKTDFRVKNFFHQCRLLYHYFSFHFVFRVGLIRVLERKASCFGVRMLDPRPDHPKISRSHTASCPVQAQTGILKLKTL